MSFLSHHLQALVNGNKIWTEEIMPLLESLHPPYGQLCDPYFVDLTYSDNLKNK